MCTANVCRSPMAAALLGVHLAARGAPARVESAGLLEGGLPVRPEAVAVLRGWGVDLSDHESRRLEPEMIAGADLVLGMAREHVREVVLLDPPVFECAFTLRELVRRGEAIGPCSPTGSRAAWLALVGAGREETGLLGPSALDDVPDPSGGPERAYRTLARELDALTARLTDLLVPPPGSGSSGPQGMSKEM